MISEAQRKAMKTYNDKIKQDPEKIEKLRQKRRQYASTYRQKIKENQPKLKEIQEKNHQKYMEWKTNTIENDIEKYNEYLFKSRLKYWLKLHQTKSTEDFENALMKLKRNRPDFYERLLEKID